MKKSKGRPKLPAKKLKSMVIRVCVTKEQYKFFHDKLGADWLRRIIDDSLTVKHNDQGIKK